MKPPKRVRVGLVILVFVLLSYLGICASYSYRHLLRTSEQSPAERLWRDVGNSTLGFQNILVVGLPSRTDRRDGMVLQAGLSNINIEFIDGVIGSDVPDKAVPVSKGKEHLRGAALGSWRAHMNAIQEAVRRNLSSVLILEDDVDWDVRVRDQLRDFALASRALTQPLALTGGDSHQYADLTFPSPGDNSPGVVNDLSFGHLPATVPPRTSPYGDDWDVLWLGHCGMCFPREDSVSIPKGRIIRHSDETVAAHRHLWSLSKPFELVDKYPLHTRAYHHTQDGVCSLAYAVSQRRARRLLHEVGLKDVSEAFDILLRFFCEGGRGRRSHLCLTTQPGLFHHHRPAGPHAAESDISKHGDGWRDQSVTDMVRWSVRLNADAIRDGETVLHDQYPDSES